MTPFRPRALPSGFVFVASLLLCLALPAYAQDEMDDLRLSGGGEQGRSDVQTGTADPGPDSASGTPGADPRTGGEGEGDDRASRRLPPESERGAAISDDPGTARAAARSVVEAARPLPGDAAGPDPWLEVVASVRGIEEIVSRNEPAEDAALRTAVEQLVRRADAAGKGKLAQENPRIAALLGELEQDLREYLSADPSGHSWYELYDLSTKKYRRWNAKDALLGRLRELGAEVDAAQAAWARKAAAGRPMSVPVSARFPRSVASRLPAGELPEVTVRSPSGKTRKLWAFPDGDGYSVRLMATEPGTWEASSAGEKVSVEVAGGARGVVGIASDRPRSFTRPDGRLLVPVGMNLGWLLEGGTTEKRLEAWRRYLDAIAGSGQNWIRVWCCPWAHWLESQASGAGRYDETAAAALDAVFEMAAQRGIYVQLVTEYHGMLRKKHDWGKNPYNAANGGPCDSPSDFFSGARAKELYKRRLRYLVARYGAYENLFAWEFWNEVDLTLVFHPFDIISWHEEMADYLRAIDPYGHLISTSTAATTRFYGSLWSIRNIDFVNIHNYEHDLAENLPRHTGRMRRYGKPVLIAESGQDSAWEPYIWETKFDPDGIGLHDSLFAGLAGGSAGTGMFWWWDKYIETDSRYGQFSPAAKAAAFIEGGGGRMQPVEADVDGWGSWNVRRYALGSPTRLLLWVKDEDYLPTEDVPSPKAETLGPFDLQIETDAEASWKVTRIDTWTGAETALGTHRSDGDWLELRVDSIQRDALFLAERQ